MSNDNGEPSIRDNSSHGVDFSMDGPLFAIGEIACQPTACRVIEACSASWRQFLNYDGRHHSVLFPSTKIL